MRGPFDVTEMRRNIKARWQQFAVKRGCADVPKLRVVIAGDFNTTSESPLFKDHLARFTDAVGVAGFG